MSQVQKILLSLFLLLTFATLIYILIKWFISSRKKMKITEMLTLNLVIKYKPFLEYLDYQTKNREKFNLYLVNINNLKLLSDKLSKEIVRKYLTKIAKDLSIYLPYGGKIAQTNTRNIFILYIPNTSENEFILGQELKENAEKVFYKNGQIIEKSASVGILDGNLYQDKNDLNKLMIALINSKRSLGEIVSYNEELKTQVKEHFEINDKLDNSDISVNLYKVLSNNQLKDEVYVDLKINDYSLIDFMNSVSLLEQSWVNMYLNELVLNELSNEKGLSLVNFPVLISLLQEELFVPYFEKLVMSNNLKPEQFVISLKLTNINDETMIIKNILNLINMGVDISLDVKHITPELFIILRNYNIKRIEIEESILESNQAAELLYFSKINHIDVLLKSNNKSVEEANALNTTYVTSLLKRINLRTRNNKKGRK